MAESNTIDDVRSLWDKSPLFTGESAPAAGTKDFINQFRQIYNDDIFAGSLDQRLFQPDLNRKRVLDVVCGVGFWFIEFARRGASDISEVDLSPRSVDLERPPCQAHKISATIEVGNAKLLQSPDESDHVNCHRAVHRTVRPQAAVREIYRLVKTDSTATIAVYYRNTLLRHWERLHPLLRPIPIDLKGRSRERLSALRNADKIAHRYDGAKNPIGLANNRNEFRELPGPFDVEQFCFHYFPRRALPGGIFDSVHHLLDWTLPFMIYANVVKTPTR